jgi:large subunit ribosomal protein L9
VKIVLRQDVEHVGQKGDIVDVADGYARNFLVPQRLAVVATKGAEQQVATIRKAREIREIRDLGSARDVASQLGALSVRLPSRAGDGGRLFGSVTPADVAEAVVKAGGPKLDKRRLSLAAPIKSLGTHTVTVRLHPEVEARITVEVVAQT